MGLDPKGTVEYTQEIVWLWPFLSVEVHWIMNVIGCDYPSLGDVWTTGLVPNLTIEGYGLGLGNFAIHLDRFTKKCDDDGGCPAKERRCVRMKLTYEVYTPVGTVGKEADEGTICATECCTKTEGKSEQ